MRPEALYDRPLVVMGVAGSGKSTIASALSRCLGREFRDGDSFHSPDNVAKMARGQALTDHDRLPWLDSIAAWLAATPGGIVACSALRESYRDRLRVAGPLCSSTWTSRLRRHASAWPDVTGTSCPPRSSTINSPRWKGQRAMNPTSCGSTARHPNLSL